MNVTVNAAAILAVFVDDPDRHVREYLLRKETGLSAGTVSEVLARLETAGSIARTDSGGVSGGPARVTYRLGDEAMQPTRREVTTARAARLIPGMDSSTAAAVHRHIDPDATCRRGGEWCVAHDARFLLGSDRCFRVRHGVRDRDDLPVAS